MRRRAPAPIADVLRRAVGEVAPDTLIARVQTAWPSAVGDVVAAEAQPSEEREGTVKVECSGAVWAQELELMAPDLLARLNASLGGPAVRRLRFVVKAS